MGLKCLSAMDYCVHQGNASLQCFVLNLFEQCINDNMEKTHLELGFSPGLT